MRIRALGQVPSAVREALVRQGIRRTKQLLLEIGEDYGVGRDRVATKTGLSTENIDQVLIAELDYEAPIWRLAIRQMVFVLLGTAIVALIGYLVTRPATQPDTVRARRELEALRLLAAADLETAPSARPGLRDPADAIGRRLLVPLEKGQTLTEAHLTPANLPPGVLEGRALLELPLEGEGSELESLVGSEVRLLFSPKVLDGQGSLQIKAFILTLKRESDENLAIVAVDPWRVAALGRFLATSKIYVARMCCPEPV